MHTERLTLANFYYWRSRQRREIGDPIIMKKNEFDISVIKGEEGKH